MLKEFNIDDYKYEEKDMPWEVWKSSFLPTKNIFNPTGPLEGMLFIHEGVDWNYVVGQYVQKLWTLIEEDGKFYLTNGLYVKGRVGYTICERMHNPREIFKVRIPDSLIESLPPREH